MIDPESQSILLDILRRESRSFLHYIGDAFPWTSSLADERLPTLRKLIRTEAEAVAAIGRYLARQRIIPPPLGPYPMLFTSWNFLSLDFLLPRLIETEKQSIEALQADLPRLSAGNRRPIEELLGIKRMNLAALEGMQTPRPEAVSA